ncbi:MAG: sugar phosphate isomerase/epimerase [Chloroflexi bacterium]|nr:MAG: sugar phosphate isomerase/epimerase [Chloroflexota bacterium]
MKLGVVGLLPPWEQIDEEAARRVRAAGFCGVSIFFQRPLETDLVAVRKLKSALDAAGLEVAQANGWYEVLVHPDESLRAEGIRGVQALCRIGRVLDAPSVYVRPGSLNPRGAWYPHAANHTAETFDRLVDSLKKASRAAQEEGEVLGLEGHVLSPLDSPRRVRDVLDAVGSPALKFNIDPVNFLGTVRDVHDPRPVLAELVDLLGKDTIAAHLKDCALRDALVIHVDEVVIGEGTLDYDFLMPRLEQVCPDVYCIIEHLPDEKIPQARVGILRSANRVGVRLQM